MKLFIPLVFLLLASCASNAPTCQTTTQVPVTPGYGWGRNTAVTSPANPTNASPDDMKGATGPKGDPTPP